MKKNGYRISSILLIASSLALLAAVFLNLWSISLSAPQYPQGLRLYLYSYKIGGDVKVINGLNHYIGMKELNEENFIEFKILPYILVFFAVCCLLVSFKKIKKGLPFLFYALLLFEIVAIADFYRWNYNYGHNLNPNAPLQVPGMSYQPPVFGCKNLLNFEACSFPDTGGFLLFAATLLVLFSYVKENGLLSKIFKKRSVSALPLTFLFIPLLAFSCRDKNAADPIDLNREYCADCKMVISDGKFAAEFITKKNRAYKFDDIACMRKFLHTHPDIRSDRYFVSDYDAKNLFPAALAAYIVGGKIKSPMRGNIAAFESRQKAEDFKRRLGATDTDWNTIIEK